MGTPITMHLLLKVFNSATTCNLSRAIAKA